jgi:hypothetical protein
MNNKQRNLYATNTISAVFKCTIDRAFKTPILGDATKILIGPGGFRLVVGFVNDETWGTTGGHRVPVANGFLFLKPREHGFDQIFARDENRYWKWGVSKFDSVFFFFSIENCGEWWVTDNNNGTISATWKYTWFSRNIITHPINWLFVKLVWSRIMKNGMANIKQMAEMETPYIYNK